MEKTQAIDEHLFFDRSEWIEKLLLEELPIEKRYQIFYRSIDVLKKVEGYRSYYEIVQDILPILERNVETFEKRKCFLKAEIYEYVQKYKMFLNEYLKYQIWLMGRHKDCDAVRKILDYRKVHVLGEVQNEIEGNEYDYVIVCSEMIDYNQVEREKIVNFSLLRLCAWKISPESAYLDIKLRQKISMGGVEGIVTGLSYQQRGINFEKLERNFVCLATPSQDLFLDYWKFFRVNDELVVKRNGMIKYCIIGMDFYRLWYDLSLSEENRRRMLCLYNLHRTTHHYHEMDLPLQYYPEDIQICNEIMIEHYMDIDYCNTFHPENIAWVVNDEYQMTDETYIRDSEEIKKVFHKPYPETFKENVGILKRFFKYLVMHQIKILIYIPPFPLIFNEFTNLDMKRITLEVLSELREIYGFDILDLSNNSFFMDDKLFADWSHLNAKGADLATELLNDYMREIWG